MPVIDTMRQMAPSFSVAFASRAWMRLLNG